MAPFSDAVILRNLSDEGCIPNLTVVHPSFGALFVEGTPVDIEVDHGCPETGWSAYKLRLSVVNDGSIAPTVSDGPRQTAFGLGPGFHAIQIDLLDANTREQFQGSAFVAIVVQSAGDVDDSSRFVTILQQWRTKLSEEPRPHLPQVSGAAPRVLFVKHAGSGGFAFSGTSRSTLWQMETLFHRGFETDLLALVGQEGIEPSEKFFDDAFKQLGRDYLHRQPPRVLHRQVTCRVSTCPLLWDIMENELPAVESFSQAPRALREAFESLLLLSSEYNVIVGSLGEPLTEALFHLVRLRFPRIRRVALLAGGVDLLRDPHRMHVFLAPSFYVADHDTIRRSGVPVRTIPYGFDTFRTWNPEIVTPSPFGGQSQDSKSQAVSGSVHAASDDSAPLVVVFSGRLSAEKGLGQLLLAWGILQERLRQRPREDGRPVALWVIGGGADQRYQSLLQELATELSAEESVHFWGWVGPKDMVAVYQRADIAVCPYTSHERETFGRAAVEAMAMGLPVVQYGVGGMSQYAINGTTAVLPASFSPPSMADALFDLVHNDTKRLAIGRQSRDFVRTHFSMDQCEENVFRAYAEQVNLYRAT